MKFTWTRFGLAFLVALLLATASAFSLPKGRARILGLVRGEPFASDYMPLSYHIARLKASDARVLDDSLNRIGLLGKRGRAAVPAVIALVNDPVRGQKQITFGYRIKDLALGVLGDIGQDAPEVAPALVEALQGPDLSLRQAAARALGKLGPVAAPAVPALVRAFREDRDVRIDVARSLRHLDLTALKRAVAAGLDEKERDTRWASIQSLEGLGSLPDLAPLIRKAAHDPDPLVAREAIKILRQFGDPVDPTAPEANPPVQAEEDD